MKTFMAIYLGSADSAKRKEWDALDNAVRQQRTEKGMAAWGDWMATHQKSIVVEGGPLGKTKRAASAGVSDTKNNLSGFVVIRAESHEAAARLFEHHPSFAIFPGESVEVMEVMPIPGR